MSTITLASGVALKIERVDRRELDKFAAVYPAPRPPTRPMEVWGGATELVEDENDPDYVRAAVAYRVRLTKLQFDLLASAMTILDYDWQQDDALQELVEMGIATLTKRDYLAFVALGDQADLRRATDEVLYLSTVTERGIEEAEHSYDVSWYGQALSKFKIKTTAGRYSRMFEERKAAQYSHYSWDAFCDLPGCEQSAIVAFYRLDTRLAYLIEREQQHK